jgi:hypothetical protein
MSMQIWQIQLDHSPVNLARTVTREGEVNCKWVNPYSLKWSLCADFLLAHLAR